jgi:hypothetical protein
MEDGLKHANQIIKTRRTFLNSPAQYEIVTGLYCHCLDLHLDIKFRSQVSTLTHSAMISKKQYCRQ